MNLLWNLLTGRITVRWEDLPNLKNKSNKGMAHQPPSYYSKKSGNQPDLHEYANPICIPCPSKFAKGFVGLLNKHWDRHIHKWFLKIKRLQFQRSICTGIVRATAVTPAKPPRFVCVRRALKPLFLKTFVRPWEVCPIYYRMHLCSSIHPNSVCVHVKMPLC